MSEPDPTPVWKGEEATVAGMAAFAAPQTQPQAPSPSAENRWDGHEATVAGMAAFTAPAAAPPAVPAGTQQRWDGHEDTICVTPAAAAAAAPGSEIRQPATGSTRWDGHEDTVCQPAAPGVTPLPAGRTPLPAVPTPTPRDGHTPAPAPKATASSADQWYMQGRPGDMTGQVFGDYEIGTVLGEGGMGTVYRARQRSLARRVAVKTLSSQYSQDAVQRARFEIEARNASLLQSPYVVAVYAAGSHNDTSYFVMEYVAGTNLAAEIATGAETGRMPEPAVVLQRILDAAQGLAVAAARNVVHRDIKPGNLLIGDDGHVKIADFGISKLAGESNLTRTGTAVGTPSYVSPEQGRGEPCDARSDIYSLGVVFYEALVLQKPFTGDTADAIIYQHNYAEPKLPRTIRPDVPETYQAVIVRCLQKDPAKRYQTADELISDLRRIQTGDVSVTAVMQARYGTGAEEAMRRRLGRRARWALPVAAALLLAAGSTGGLWWWQSQREARSEARRVEDRVRTELRATLDRVAPPPPSAGADLTQLASIVGERDPDVARWRAKIEQMQQLQTRLAALDTPDLPSATLRVQAAGDLVALAALIGAETPEQQRWQGRLAEADTEVQRLRRELVELDGIAEVTVAQRERLQPPLARLAHLVTGSDGEVERWQRRMTALEARLEALRSRLAGLDQQGALPTELELTAAGAVLDELRQRHGTAPAGADETRWRETVARHRAAIARARDAVTRACEAVPTAAALDRLDTELAVLRKRVEADDAVVMRAESHLAGARARLSDLAERVTVLDRADSLTLSELESARSALDTLTPLADPGDTRLRARGDQLRQAQARIEGWRLELEPLHSPEAQPVALVERARTALAELDRRLAVAADVKAQVARRLAEEDRRLADLRTRCAAADGPVTITQALVDDILLFGRLVGEDTAEFKRWRPKIIDYVELRRRLAGLDRAAPLPAEVDAALVAYERIVGADDAGLVAWRAKVARVRTLLAGLAVLDRREPVPEGAAAWLAELRALVGDLPQAPAWEARIARVSALMADSRRDLAPQVLRLRPEVPARLDALRTEVGETPELAAWQRRVAELNGPGRPAWATADGNDSRGPWAAIDLPAAGALPALRIELRWLPNATSQMGSAPDEPGRDGDEGQVQVVRTRGVWMAATETTRAQWQRVTGGQAAGEPDPEAPVVLVSYPDALAYATALARLAPGAVVRLPTEAEWECACRADNHDPALLRGDTAPLDRGAWYRGTARDRAHPVGRHDPNPLGFYDLLGNVWEWCADRYAPYPMGTATDPIGRGRDEGVVRGGSYADPARLVRAANRVAVKPDLRTALVGFRIVIE